ncbi:MAG: UDP-3-O-(3-hydroxymyristoyl)glucosamine N-acyltransferase [Bacteroidota bacterium]
MHLQVPLSLPSLAADWGLELIGDPSLFVTGINEIHKVTPGDLTYCDHPKYYPKVLASAASVILINARMVCPPGKCLLVCDEPFEVYNRLVSRYRPFSNPMGRHYHAGQDVQIGEDTVIMQGVVLGDRVRIGRSCVIHPNVVIYSDTILGDRVVIHAGSVLGADAFYYKKRNDGHYDRLLSCGRVIVHNNVEIGAACTIDKGVSGDTILGEGTKLDNQVHLGHGVVVGKNCLIAAQVGVGGKTRIADGVCLWGQVGVQKDIDIGPGAQVLGQSGVTKSIPGGKTYFGTPARDVRDVHRETIALRQWSKSKGKPETNDDAKAKDPGL